MFFFYFLNDQLVIEIRELRLLGLHEFGAAFSTCMLRAFKVKVEAAL
jgi:hypothetical protein